MTKGAETKTKKPGLKRQRLAALNAVMGTSKARRILADIEADMEAKRSLKEGNSRQRRTYRMQEDKLIVFRVKMAKYQTINPQPVKKLLGW